MWDFTRRVSDCEELVGLLTGVDGVGFSFKARADLVKIQEFKLFANWLDKSIKNNNFVSKYVRIQGLF